MLRWRSKYPILDAKDVLTLDDAVKRIKSAGIDEAVAIPAAYGEYSRPKHEEAAAHHWAGMEALSGGRGRDDQKSKHKTMYELHLRQLGMRGAPALIQAKSREAKDSVGGGFTQHPNDKLLTPRK